MDKRIWFVLTLHRAGVTQKTIGGILGISASSVARLLVKAHALKVKGELHA